jgi:ElaB/YqjD/DUF883 family membrane-anchored ribosome-binding protein
MAAQRAALDEKLDCLENRIVQTVDSAREAVAETVQTVKEAVQSSVETVKEAVQSSVEAVKETFDVPRHVQRHPWAMFGGSVALGFAAGYILNHMTARSRSPGFGSGKYYAGDDNRYTAAAGSAPFRFEQPQTGGSTAAEAQEAHQPTAGRQHDESWASELSRTFAPEVQKLKGLAIGTLMAVVRDVVGNAISEPLRPKVNELLDSVTTKLGGEPVEGPVLDEFLHRRQDEHPNGRRSSSEAARA